MPRSYDDGCAAAHALDLVGERWALLIVREMLLGPKRFTDLRAGLPGISPNVLSQRLDELGSAGVITRYRLLPPAGSWVYELTPWGRDLEPIILALGHWGARSPFRGCSALSPDSLMLSLRTMFDPPACGDLHATYEFRVGDYRFHAEVIDSHLIIERGSAEQPDVILTGDPDTIAAVVYEGADPAALTIEGDPAAFTRFIGLFRKPTPATGPAGAQRARRRTVTTS